MGTLKTYTVDLFRFLWGLITKKDVVMQFESTKDRNIAHGKVLLALLAALLFGAGTVFGWFSAWGPFAGDANTTFILMLSLIFLGTWGFLGYTTSIIYKKPTQEYGVTAEYAEDEDGLAEEDHVAYEQPVQRYIVPQPMPQPLTVQNVVSQKDLPNPALAQALNAAYAPPQPAQPNATLMQIAMVLTIAVAVIIVVKTAIELLPFVLSAVGAVLVWKYVQRTSLRIVALTGMLVVSLALFAAISGLKEGNFIGKWVAEQFSATQAEQVNTEPVQIQDQAPPLPTQQPAPTADPRDTAEELGKAELVQGLEKCVVGPLASLQETLERVEESDRYIGFEIMLHGDVEINATGMETNYESCNAWLSTGTTDSSGANVEGGFLQRVMLMASPDSGRAPIDANVASLLADAATVAINDIQSNLLYAARALESVDGESPDFEGAGDFIRDANTGIRDLNALLISLNAGDALKSVTGEKSIPEIQRNFVGKFKDAFERYLESQVTPTPTATPVPTAVPFVPQQAPVIIYPTAVPPAAIPPTAVPPVQPSDGCGDACMPTW